MNRHQLQELKQKLQAGGVSYIYVRRLLRELKDHYQDLFDQAREDDWPEEDAHKLASQSLGDYDQVVDEMIKRPELKNYAHRFPITVLVIAPAVLFLLVSILSIMMIVAISTILYPENTPILSRDIPAGFRWLLISTRIGLMYILPLLLALVFLYYGKSNGVSTRLSWIGIILLTILASSSLMVLRFPDPENGIINGSIGASIGVGLFQILDFSHFFSPTDMKLRALILLGLVVLVKKTWFDRIDRQLY